MIVFYYLRLTRVIMVKQISLETGVDFLKTRVIIISFLYKYLLDKKNVIFLKKYL